MIKHFFECTVPISKCNLYCEYCYVAQENRRNINTPSLNTAVSKWKKAISSDRIGKCFFSFCGYGETMLAGDAFLRIVYDTLDCGHIVNITNNGTITEAIGFLVRLPYDMQKRLLLSFSLHYEELEKRGLLEVFASNVKRVMRSEASCFVQINLCDAYAKKMDSIKSYCLENFGCLPQVATTRREKNQKFSIYTDLPIEEYEMIGKTYESKLFSFTFKNFNEKRTEFCYAGEFSYKLDVASGDLQRCYFEAPFVNIYEDTISEIPEKPIGNHCGLSYCVNSSHFLALGNICGFTDESYVDLRNRECRWIKNDVKQELSSQFTPQKYHNVGIIREQLRNKKVMLYGAGKTAREIIAYLKKSEILVDMIFVSSKGDKECLDNIPIVEFDDESKKMIDGNMMIISMKNYNQVRMIKKALLHVECFLIDYYDMFLLEDFFIGE